MQNKVALAQALEALQASGDAFKTMLEHGTLSVELYKPDAIDSQTPHDRDEVYIIATGGGKFILEDSITAFSPGDFLFVPAGAHHRFIDFTPDFSTWVMFYGPRGGERSNLTNYIF
ncbi:cupin domain-containing protein [Cesiribacter sp. SM1]|uniref:cupin domain-containing protein n=1 Tax=Cesiribacter sp. SM1 TaxID=2861196 RepID=UPI001CD1964D|nr:cupin domain-containing protein [Cesiribacter sp. SM1]